jgi:hypothetical protein
MFTAPVTPIAALHRKSDAGPSTSRNAGSTAAVAPADATSSSRRPMRSDSAPNTGARKPRSRFSHRKASPTVASAMCASCTNQMPRKVTRLMRAATAMKFAARTTRMRGSTRDSLLSRVSRAGGGYFFSLPSRLLPRLSKPFTR